MSAPSMAEILKLSPKRRLEMVEAIWDSLANNPADVPVPSSHVREVTQRNAKYEADPEGSTATWNEVKRQVRGKLEP